MMQTSELRDGNYLLEFKSEMNLKGFKNIWFKCTPFFIFKYYYYCCATRYRCSHRIPNSKCLTLWLILHVFIYFDHLYDFTTRI